MLPFKWIERTYGLLGLFMIVFAAALVAIHPPWDKIAGGFVPQVPHGLSTKELLTFGYFMVAIISAVMFPYEVYFYSSGGIEEGWGPKDLMTNRVTSDRRHGPRLAPRDRHPGQFGPAVRAGQRRSGDSRQRRARSCDPVRQMGA